LKERANGGFYKCLLKEVRINSLFDLEIQLLFLVRTRQIRN